MTATQTRPTPTGTAPPSSPPDSPPRKPGGLGVRTEFVLCALVIAAVALGGAWYASYRTGQSAKLNAREDASVVAARTASSISVGLESGVSQLAKLAQLSNLNEITSLAPGSDTDAKCQATMALLSSQGFSFVVANGKGEAVCTGVAAGATESERSAAGPVLQWLNSASGWQQLGGDPDAPLTPGRMTLDPGGRSGNATVAVPLKSGSVAVWLAAWRAFVPPMDAAISAPGVESVMLIDNAGKVVVGTPRLVDGQPPAGRARSDKDDKPIAPRLGTSDVYQQTVGLEPGTPSGVRPSTADGGGPTEASIEGNWVTVPVPRLPVHVAVAYSEAQARELQSASLRYGLAAALAVLLASLLVLFLLARHIASPLSKLALAAHRARDGAEFDAPQRGPTEIRQLSAEVTDLVKIRSQVGEVASAARERERERVARLLNGDVSQRIASASLLTESNPGAAQSELAVAQERLGQVTAELDPPTLPTGGVGPALTAYAATTSGASVMTVEDLTRGLRMDAARERALYRTTLEVAQEAWDAGAGQVHVGVSQTRDGVSASVSVPPGQCPPYDNAAYFDQHEFTSAGGSVRREGSLPDRVLVLEI